MSLVEKAARAYQDRYGHPPPIAAEAPGRVNLIGEHVDYNDGVVMPMAIDKHIVVCLGASPDSTFRLATGSEGLTRSEFTEVAPGEPFWSNYVRGVIAGFEARGIKVAPFQAWIEADLPIGSGLSSSAALEVAVATALEAYCGHEVSTSARARAGGYPVFTHGNLNRSGPGEDL